MAAASTPKSVSELDIHYQQLREIDEAVTRVSWNQLIARRSTGEALLYDPEEDPQKRYDGMIDEYDAVKRSLYDMQSTIRKEINEHSRPFLRPLRILDMPDEILMEIFGYIKGWEPEMSFFQEHQYSVPDIQNIRLTCQRFCSTSSHLLLDYVYVELNPISVMRLDEISRHPTISKGVTSIIVILAYHNSGLAQDIESFAHYHADELRPKIDFAENMYRDQGRKWYPNISEDTVQKLIKRLRAIAKSWEEFPEEVPDDSNKEDDLRCPRKLLRKAYEEYHGEWVFQESILENNNFSELVAVAMARMPVAKRLDLCDDDRCGFTAKRRRTLFEQAEDDEVFISQTLHSMRWEATREYHLGSPPAEIIFKLPAACHKLGIAIEELNIRISPPDYLGVLKMSEKDRLELTAAVQRLTNFTFLFRGAGTASNWRPYQRDETENFGEIISAILDTDSIERFNLDFSPFWDEEMPPLYSLGSFITRRQWPRLDLIYWKSMCLRMSELERFIDGLKIPLRGALIRYPHLMDGSWADSLDILRRKAPSTVSLANPSGGDWEGLSEEEKEKAFEKGKDDIWERSKAEKFILKLIKVNPLRELDGETDAMSTTESTDSETMDTVE
ncbi:hypothetical protein G7Y89_g9465 [Cudoniella acicularis]|uniref:F-box domain-containing protein n=1 Tax=Cudoniella acicularis TaxID=354080 RepID=A0A8H4REL5_9HELO|nr:hypothetical protein G7Y89_g9465 [Cudoniella acicularis]